MKGKGKRLNIASISDIHLGHSSTPTEHILQNLYNTFKDDEHMAKLDIIFLAGDVFDKLLFLPDPNVIEIQIWMHHFLTLCAKHNVLVRVLEGTPSHDRGQPQQFVTVKQLGNIPVNLVYQDTLCIEYIDEKDITVLYLPDEWDHDPDVTWEKIQTLLQSHALEQVDFICMHGQFEYHLGLAHLNIPTHSSERFLAIVRHFILIGHIHFMSVEKTRILTAGSFDGLRHNEEQPKGHFRVAVDPKGIDNRITFVENTNAMRYTTLDVCHLEEEALWEFLTVIDTYPKGTHVRIQCHKTQSIRQSLPLLNERYPDIKFKCKVVATETVQTDVTGITEKYHSVQITPTNLPELLYQKIDNTGIDATIASRIRELLNQVI